MYTRVFSHAQKPLHVFMFVDARGTDGFREPLFEEVDRVLEEYVRERMDTKHVQHQFEELVQGLNQVIAARATDSDWDLNLADLHILFGMAGDDALFLTGVGDVVAQFLHAEPHGRYKVFNLSRNLHTESHLYTWSKTFSVVLDGDLADGDILLVGNRELLQHVDAQDVNTILSTLPPESAVERFRQFFPHPADIGLVILKAVSSSGESMPTPSDAPSSLAHLKNTRDIAERMIEHQRPRKEDWGRIGRATAHVGKSILVSSLQVALALIMGSIKELFFLGKGLSEPKRRRQISDAFRRISLNARSKVRLGAHTVSAFKNTAPASRKRLLAIAGAVLLVLVVVLLFFSFQKKHIREAANYETLMEDIQDALDVASASIIYQDTEEARQKLVNGLALLEALPETARTDRLERQETLRAGFERELNVLRKLTPVETLTLLASLPEGVQAHAIGFDNTTSYLFSTDGAVYQFDASSQALNRIGVDTPENLGPLTRVRYDDVNDVLYVFDGRQIAQFDPDQLTYAIHPITDLSEGTDDFDFYARRIYALSSENEQVYRHDRSGDGFSAPVRWLEARTVTLSDALSLSVDGSVWVLKANGQIVKYSGGLEETWRQDAIDPPLGGDPVLWTTDRVDDLLILDASGGRIVVIQKSSGKLIYQLTHDAFKDASGVFERDGEIFVATQTGLHSFTRP